MYSFLMASFLFVTYRIPSYLSRVPVSKVSLVGTLLIGEIFQNRFWFTFGPNCSQRSFKQALKDASKRKGEMKNSNPVAMGTKKSMKKTTFYNKYNFS